MVRLFYISRVIIKKKYAEKKWLKRMGIFSLFCTFLLKRDFHLSLFPPGGWDFHRCNWRKLCRRRLLGSGRQRRRRSQNWKEEKEEESERSCAELMTPDIPNCLQIISDLWRFLHSEIMDFERTTIFLNAPALPIFWLLILFLIFGTSANW